MMTIGKQFFSNFAQCYKKPRNNFFVVVKFFLTINLLFKNYVVILKIKFLKCLILK